MAALLCGFAKPATVDEILGMVGPEHFADYRNAELLSHVIRMRAQGKPVDPVTVSGCLSGVGLSTEQELEYLDRVLRSLGVLLNAPYYAGMVREAADRRALLRLGERALQLAHAGGEVEGGPCRGRELLNPDSTGPVPNGPEILTLADVLARQVTADYVVPGLLAADCPGVVGGLFKSLKTSFALDLFISIGTGTPCLGFFPVNRLASATYFCGEGGLAFVCDVCKRICRAKGIDGADAKLNLVPWIPTLDTSQHLTVLADVLRKTAPEFVFIDPLYVALGEASREASNVYVMGQRMQALLRACEPTHTTPILVHHFKKNRDENSPASLADLSQAGLAEFAGQWCLLSRQSAYDPERPGSHDLWLTLGSRLGHSARWSVQVEEGRQDSPGGRYWQTQVASPEDARDKVQQQREQERSDRAHQRIETDRAAIVRAMSKYPEGETGKVIRAAAGLSGTRFSAALADLIQSGDVILCEIQKPNRKRLTTATD